MEDRLAVAIAAAGLAHSFLGLGWGVSLLIAALVAAAMTLPAMLRPLPGGLRLGAKVRARREVRCAGKAAAAGGDVGTVIGRGGADGSKLLVRWDQRRDHKSRPLTVSTEAVDELPPTIACMTQMKGGGLGGRYLLAARLGPVNAQPAWRCDDGSRPRWLCSTPRGRWCITEDLKGVKDGRAIAFAAQRHRGRLPHAAPPAPDGEGGEEWRRGDRETVRVALRTGAAAVAEVAKQSGAERERAGGAALPAATEDELFPPDEDKEEEEEEEEGEEGGQAEAEAEDAEDAVPAAEVAAADFAMGDRVELVGLSSAQLNGVSGRVTGRQGERMTVLLEGIGQRAVNAGNLARMPWAKGRKYFEGWLPGKEADPTVRSWVEELSASDDD